MIHKLSLLKFVDNFDFLQICLMYPHKFCRARKVGCKLWKTTNYWNFQNVTMQLKSFCMYSTDFLFFSDWAEIVLLLFLRRNLSYGRKINPSICRRLLQWFAILDWTCSTPKVLLDNKKAVSTTLPKTFYSKFENLLLQVPTILRFFGIA